MKIDILAAEFTNDGLAGVIALSRLHGPKWEGGSLSDSEIRFAIANGLGPWCFAQIKRKEIIFSAEGIDSLRRTYMETMLRNNHMVAVGREVNRIFEGAGIPMVALKGIALATTVYNDPALRPMGDMDLLVPEGKGRAAVDLLLKNGARAMSVPRSSLHEEMASHMRPLQFKGVMVEVHQLLYAKGSGLNLPADQMANCFLLPNDVENSWRVLPDVLFAYHLASHAYYGWRLGGLRLGWFLDIALLVDRQKDVDAFVNEVKQVNAHAKAEVGMILDWSMAFRDDGLPCAKAPFPDVSVFQQPDGIKKTHRLENLRHIVQTPGVFNKAGLFVRELFPTAEYMRFRYGNDGALAYAKRLLGKG